MAPSAVTTTTHPGLAPAQGKEMESEQLSTEKKKSPLEMISQGVSLPGIPQFVSFGAHRQWMLEHMAIAFRVFARKGYSEGMSGHISVRDPEYPDTFWTNPLAVHFGMMKASEMVLLASGGQAIGGNPHRPANAAGFLIHGAVHQARPDVIAVCHTHSPAGKAWSAFARPLEMLNQDVTVFYGDAQAVYTECGGIVFGEAEGKRIAAALGPNGKGMILRNHGLLTVGSTVDEAAYLYTLMERSCEVQLKIEAAAANGLAKVHVPDEAARYTYENSSDPETLYWEFQPDLEYEAELCNHAHKM